MTAPITPKSSRVFRDGAWSASSRDLIGETAIAIVVNGSSEAVMMATAADLEDFALGFALTEGLITGADQIASLDIVSNDLGIEARLWLVPEANAVFNARRRRRAGPVGCGLCGVESLEEAMRPVPLVQSDLTVSAVALSAAMRTLSAQQPLHTATKAAHAAALFRPATGIMLAREDIGRHNALDKLVGALTRTSQQAQDDAAILMTSRLSVELVQKTAFVGAPLLAAISAPSSLAIEIADKAGLTLCGVVRDNGLEVFTHPYRVV